jgi:hypothetical protein
VCDTASVLDEGMRSVRDQRKARPIVWANGQAAIWRESGLLDVVEAPIVISFDYASFEDYWSSFSMPIGPNWPACSGTADGAARGGRAARPQRVSGWPVRRTAVVRRHRPCGAGHCTGRRLSADLHLTAGRGRAGLCTGGGR